MLAQNLGSGEGKEAARLTGASGQLSPLGQRKGPDPPLESPALRRWPGGHQVTKGQEEDQGQLGAGWRWQQEPTRLPGQEVRGPHSPTQGDQAGPFLSPVGLLLPSSWDPYFQAA